METFIGTIVMFGFPFAPKGWQQCAGQLLSIAQNTALFSLLGTTYGGNGQTNFALPDLRGRVPIGVGQGPGLSAYVIGEDGGSQTNTLNGTQLPPHTHQAEATSTSTSTSTSTLYAERVAQSSANPAGNMLGTASIYVPPATQENRAMSSEAITTATTTTTTTAVTVQPAGAGQPVNNMQPYIAMNYCICIEGLYPSRN